MFNFRHENDLIFICENIYHLIFTDCSFSGPNGGLVPVLQRRDAVLEAAGDGVPVRAPHWVRSAPMLKLLDLGAKKKLLNFPYG